MSSEVEDSVASARAAWNPTALAAVEPLLDAKGAAAASRSCSSRSLSVRVDPT